MEYRTRRPPADRQACLPADATSSCQNSWSSPAGGNGTGCRSTAPAACAGGQGRERYTSAIHARVLGMAGTADSGCPGPCRTAAGDGPGPGEGCWWLAAGDGAVPLANLCSEDAVVGRGKDSALATCVPGSAMSAAQSAGRPSSTANEGIQGSSSTGKQGNGLGTRGSSSREPDRTRREDDAPLLWTSRWRSRLRGSAKRAVQSSCGQARGFSSKWRRKWSARSPALANRAPQCCRGQTKGTWTRICSARSFEVTKPTPQSGHEQTKAS